MRPLACSNRERSRLFGKSRPVVSSGTSCIAIDKANNVFVNSGSNSVWEYAAGSSKVIRTITNGVSSVDALALDSKGTLYVANASQSPSHGWISIYPPGVTRETYRITDGVNLPVALLLDHDDNLFVSNDGGMFGHSRLLPRERTLAARIGEKSQWLSRSDCARVKVISLLRERSAPTPYQPVDTTGAGARSTCENILPGSDKLAGLLREVEASRMLVARTSVVPSRPRPKLSSIKRRMLPNSYCVWEM